jgi:hypothetical protein
MLGDARLRQRKVDVALVALARLVQRPRQPLAERQVLVRRLQPSLGVPGTAQPVDQRGVLLDHRLEVALDVQHALRHQVAFLVEQRHRRRVHLLHPRHRDVSVRRVRRHDAWHVLPALPVLRHASFCDDHVLLPSRLLTPARVHAVCHRHHQPCGQRHYACGRRRGGGRRGREHEHASLMTGYVIVSGRSDESSS